MKPIKKPGRTPRPMKIIETIRTPGLFWNDQTGNLHRTLKLTIRRANGQIDHGDPEYPAGFIPMHPTTGKRLDDTPENRGLKINPNPAGNVVKKSIVIDHRLRDGHGGVMKRIRINVTKVAWWKQTGEKLAPRARLRHIDGDVWNNHISNLELVSTGGLIVKTRTKARYEAATRVSGTRVSLGYHQTREAAVEAVNAFRTAAGLDPVRPYARQTVTTADQSATFIGEAS